MIFLAEIYIEVEICFFHSETYIEVGIFHFMLKHIFRSYAASNAAIFNTFCKKTVVFVFVHFFLQFLHYSLIL